MQENIHSQLADSQSANPNTFWKNTDHKSQNVLKSAKFTNGLRLGHDQDQKIHLEMGISMGKDTQQGDNLRAWVHLVNQHKSKIKSIEIIPTAYLHRHYYPEDADKVVKEMYDNWMDQNGKIIMENIDPEIKVTFQSWQGLYETKDFQEALRKVKELYNSGPSHDPIYKAEIDKLAQDNKHRCNNSIEHAKEYAMEESVYFYYKKGHTSYPSTEPNPANKQILEKHNKNLKYHGYRIDCKTEKPIPPKEEAQKAKKKIKFQEHEGQPTTDDLYIACINAAQLMEKFGMKAKNVQTGYFEKILSLREEQRLLTEKLRDNTEFKDITSTKPSHMGSDEEKYNGLKQNY